MSNEFENDYFTLTDEEGNEIDFEVIAQCERDGNTYFAMIPVEDESKTADNDICEYISSSLLRRTARRYSLQLTTTMSLTISQIISMIFSRRK